MEMRNWLNINTLNICSDMVFALCALACTLASCCKPNIGKRVKWAGMFAARPGLNGTMQSNGSV